MLSLTSCPLQTFVCNISRHFEFIIEQLSTGSPGRWIPGALGGWVTKCDPVLCLVYTWRAQARQASEDRCVHLLSTYVKG